MSGEIINIGLKPKLPPEQEEDIRVRSMETGRKIADALVRGVGIAVDGKTAGQAEEIAALRARVERLERLLAPREVTEGGG